MFYLDLLVANNRNQLYYKDRSYRTKGRNSQGLWVGVRTKNWKAHKTLFTVHIHFYSILLFEGLLSLFSSYVCPHSHSFTSNHSQPHWHTNILSYFMFTWKVESDWCSPSSAVLRARFFSTYLLLKACFCGCWSRGNRRDNF